MKAIALIGALGALEILIALGATEARAGCASAVPPGTVAAPIEPNHDGGGNGPHKATVPPGVTLEAAVSPIEPNHDGGGNGPHRAPADLNGTNLVAFRPAWSLQPGDRPAQTRRLWSVRLQPDGTVLTPDPDDPDHGGGGNGPGGRRWGLQVRPTAFVSRPWPGTEEPIQGGGGEGPHAGPFAPGTPVAPGIPVVPGAPGGPQPIAVDQGSADPASAGRPAISAEPTASASVH